MNKKIMFSLVLLSSLTYAYDKPKLNLHGDSECLNTTGKLNSCANLTKTSQNVENGVLASEDQSFIYCTNQRESELWSEAEKYHLINILTQPSVIGKPEKARYEALRQCDISYYDSRMYSAYRYIGNMDNGTGKNSPGYNNAPSFINDYKKALNNAKKTADAKCINVLNKELEYVNNETIKLANLDFTPFYDKIGQVPTIQDLKSKKDFYETIILKSKFTTNAKNEPVRKTFQEYYKEFSTNTTGLVLTSSSMANTNGRYLVYLLDQQEPKAADGYPDAYRQFGDIVGDTNFDEKNCLMVGKDNQINGNNDPRANAEPHSAGDSLLYIDERGGGISSIQGVCGNFEKFTNNKNTGTYDYNRALEMLFLKNSKIKPKNEEGSYSKATKPNTLVGGISKCYNYDIENFSSNYSRAKYFDWNNAREYAKDQAFNTFKRNHFAFSIHKNGTRLGTFSDNTKEELSKYNFSVNVRPSFKKHLIPGTEQTHTISELYVQFIPDANVISITHSGNSVDAAGSKFNTIRVTDLNDVYITLNNTLMNFTAEDVIPYNNKGKSPMPSDTTSPRIEISYLLTGYKMSVQKKSDEFGPVESAVKEVIVENKAYKLQPVKGTKYFTLSFSDKDALKNLVKEQEQLLDSEINNGARYEIVFTPIEIKAVVKEYYEECGSGNVCNPQLASKPREFIRPIFQTSGKDIIKGKESGNFTIILGGMNMPKGATLGSAYTDENNIVIDDKEIVSSKVKIADKIYTRTNEQNIFLGFKLPSEYSVENRYIKFLNEDNTDLNAKVFSKGYKLQKEVGNNDKTCNGYYKLSNEMIIQLNKKLPVSQNNKFRYKIAEFDKIFDECVELGSKESNEFTIRPEKIEYKVAGKDEIQKNAGKVDSNYTDNNVIFTSDKKDDRYGIGIAELRVEYAKPLTGEKTFNLEDKNTNLLNKVDNTTTSFVDFDKTKGEFAIKTIFPMVTDAKILLAENKFTHEDLKDGLCYNDNKVLDKNEANKISTDGKINCQTPGNEIKVKFTASQSLSFEKDAANKEIKAGVTNTNFIKYVPFSDLDNERLRIPLQIANTNNGSYFYKKYDSNTVEAELNLIYKTEPKDLSKVIINVVSDLNPKKINQNKYELSGLNDKFNDKLTALNIADKLSAYNDADFDAKNFAKLEYKIGYPKTVGGKANLEREFEISNANSKITFTNGSEEPKNSILDNPYKFAYTGLFFKDINSDKTKGASSYEIKAKNAGLLKYVENKGFEKIDDENVNNFEKLYNNAIGSFTLISDYSKEALKKNNYTIPAKLSDNQYVKDTIRFKIENSAYKYLDSFSTFTIEFIK